MRHHRAVAVRRAARAVDNFGSRGRVARRPEVEMLQHDKRGLLDFLRPVIGQVVAGLIGDDDLRRGPKGHRVVIDPRDDPALGVELVIVALSAIPSSTIEVTDVTGKRASISSALGAPSRTVSISVSFPKIRLARRATIALACSISAVMRSSSLWSATPSSARALSMRVRSLEAAGVTTVIIDQLSLPWPAARTRRAGSRSYAAA